MNDYEYACNGCGQEGHLSEFAKSGPGPGNPMAGFTFVCPFCGSDDVNFVGETPDEQDPAQAGLTAF